MSTDPIDSAVVTDPPGAAEPGPQRGRLGYIVIGVVVAVAAAGWAFVMGNMDQRPGIAVQTTAFTVVDDSSVRITYSVAKRNGQELRCVVDALDADHAEVGRLEVSIPAGVTQVQRTDTVRTSGKAVAARVKECQGV